MTRTTAREIAIQLGFAVVAAEADPTDVLDDFFESEHYASLQGESELYKAEPGDQLDFIRRSVTGVADMRIQLNATIDKYSNGWRTERIDKAAAAILRQALYEILYMPDIPVSSSIDEAVELAKGYEDADVVSFINGVLGSFYRAEIAESAEQPRAEETENG